MSRSWNMSPKNDNNTHSPSPLFHCSRKLSALSVCFSCFFSFFGQSQRKSLRSLRPSLAHLTLTWLDTGSSTTGAMAKPSRWAICHGVACWCSDMVISACFNSCCKCSGPSSSTTRFNSWMLSLSKVRNSSTASSPWAWLCFKLICISFAKPLRNLGFLANSACMSGCKRLMMLSGIKSACLALEPNQPNRKDVCSWLGLWESKTLYNTGPIFGPIFLFTVWTKRSYGHIPANTVSGHKTSEMQRGQTTMQYNTTKTCRLSLLSLKESRHLEYGWWSMPKAVYIHITSFKNNDMQYDSYDNSQVVTDHQTTILHWPLLHLLDGMQAVRGSSQNPSQSESRIWRKKVSTFRN